MMTRWRRFGPRKNRGELEWPGDLRPRAISLTAQGRALLVLSIVLMVGAEAAGLVIDRVARRQAEELNLLNRGIDAEGRVTRLWRRRGEDTSHWIAYRFDAGGETHRNQLKVPARVSRGLEVGSPLKIRYAADRPALNHPVEWGQSRPLPLWLAPLVGAALALTGGLLTLPLRRERRLLAEGRTTAGLVTGHSKADHGQKNIHFTFTLLSGATRSGRGGPTGNPPPIGGAVPVLYDPENPRRHAIYPLPLVRLAHR